MGIQFRKLAAGIASASLLAGTGALHAQTVEEQVVTGSFLATGETSTSPLEIIDGDKLQEVPRSTLADFLFADVPQNIAQDSSIETGGTQGRLSDANRNASINLRGIGKENSLVIADDVKIVAYAAPDGNGWRAVDVNSVMPGIAVRRSELLLDGGSAIYGTDAVAGVLNLIPDFGFDGFQVNLRTQNYEDDLGKKDYQVGAKWGYADGDTNILLAFEASQRDEVTDADIGIDDIDYDLSEGPIGANSNGFFTFRDVDGAGRSATTTLYPDPLCGDFEALGVQPVFANAVIGDTCAITERGEATLQTEQEITSFFAGIEHQLTDRLHVSFSGSHNTTEITDNTDWTTFTVWTGPNSRGQPTTPIPPTNPAMEYYAMIDPGGPWGDLNDELLFTGRGTASQFSYLDVRQFTTQAKTWRVLGKAEYQLTDNWDLLLTASTSESEVLGSRVETVEANMIAALTTGLGGPNCSGNPSDAGNRSAGCYWYNPFMSAALPNAAELGIDNPDELIDWVSPGSDLDFVGTLDVYSLLFRGDLDFIMLPGGPVGLAFGYEYREDELTYTGDAGYTTPTYERLGGNAIPNYKGSIDVDAYVAELSIPLLDNLNIQAAVRSEEYSTGFDTTNPKIGFNWTPNDDWTIRASWGTSFKAPSIEQTQAATAFDPSFAIFGDPDDPDFAVCPNGRRHCTVQTLTNVQQANANLQPQESTNWSAGFNWSVTDSFSFGATFVEIEFENVIDIPSASSKLRSVCLGETVTDGYFDSASGSYIDVLVPILSDACFSGQDDNNDGLADLNNNGLPIVDFAFVNPLNLGFRNIQALDLNANWLIQTDVGTLNLRPNATIVLQWDEQELPGGPVADLVGVRTRLGTGPSEYRVNLPITWEMGAHRVTLTGRYISGLEDSAGVDPWDEYYQADLNYRVNLTDDLQLSAFVNNVTDEQPDSNASNFPRDGRRIGLAVEWRFGQE